MMRRFAAGRRAETAAAFALTMLAVLLCAAGGARAQVIASSTFDANVDGWTAIGDPTGPPVFIAAGGNPGGFIRVTDAGQGAGVYWVAPAKFLGDVDAAYNQNLFFDLQTSTNASPNSPNDVILTGGGLTLNFNTNLLPAITPAWQTFVVPLSESGNWVVAGTGLAPTEAQFLQVLGSLTALQIRAEFSGVGGDVDGLDNVILGNAPASAAPEPGTVVLLGAIVLPLGAAVIRRRHKA